MRTESLDVLACSGNLRPAALTAGGQGNSEVGKHLGAALGATLMLAACGGPNDAAIEACETFIQERLRSPSTYKRISTNAFIAVDRKSGWVTVEYDAANAFGTPIRDTQICAFDTPEGNWPPKDDIIQSARRSAIGDSGGLCCDSKELDAELLNLTAPDLGEEAP